MSVDVRWTQDEAELGGVVATWLDRNWDVSRLAAGRSDVVDRWAAISGQLGLAGLLISEEAGGQGAGPREAAVVARELGRPLFPSPFVTSSVLCAPVIAECGDNADLLGGVSSGKCIVALAVLQTRFVEDDHFDAFRLQGGLLSGACRAVIDGGVATHLLVPAQEAGSPVLAVVDCTVPGVGRRPFLSVDSTRDSVDVTVDAVPAKVIARGQSAVSSLRTAILRAIAVQCAEQAGLARYCLDATTEYASCTRSQFGRQIGSFQALKHRMADMWWMTTAVESAAEVASALIEEPSLDLAELYAARVCAADYTVRVAEECLQLHGGIGMTWEGGVHFYLKRAKANQVLFGSSGLYLESIARGLDLT